MKIIYYLFFPYYNWFYKYFESLSLENFNSYELTINNKPVFYMIA